MKRLFALVLSICMVLSCLPFGAIALEAEQDIQVVTEPQPEAVVEAPTEEGAETAPVLAENAHTDHGACVCAVSGAACSHTVLTWTAWESTTTLPTEAGNYYLTGKVTLASMTTISSNVNLCLNGYDIDLNQTKIVAAGNLTIMNCQAQLNSKNQLTSAAGKLYNGKNASSGTNVEKYGGAIGVTGSLNVYGVHFNGNTCAQTSDARTGGAIYVQNGTANIESCSFNANTSKGTGGAVMLYGGTMTVKDTLFTNNEAAIRGGAIGVNSKEGACTLSITGSTEITGSKTTDTRTTAFYGAGGAIFAYKNGTDYELSITIGGNAKITGNTASQEGGGIALRNSSAAKPMQFKVQDNVQIYGNTGEGTYDNLYFENSAADSAQKVTVGTLGANAKVYVNTDAAVADPDEILALASGAALSETVTTGIYIEDKAAAYNTANCFYYPGHAHQDCICAITGTDCGSHGKDLIWTAWESTDSLPADAGNYYLTGKVTLAETVTIDTKVTLCLNGFDIDLNQKKIVNTGDLTIMHCRAQLNEKNQLTSTAGKIYNGSGPNGDGITKMGGAIGTSGSLTLIGIHLNNNVSLKASDARSGGAIYAERAAVTIESCSFSGNEAKGSGGAISTYAGTLTIKDSLFANNTAQFRGGALCVNTNTATAATNVTITGNTEFTGNKTTSTGTTVFYGAGGAIFLYKNGTAHELNVTISGNTKITGNTASQEGGGIALRNSDGTKPMQFTLQDGVQVYDNTGESTFDNLYFENSSQVVKIGALGAGAKIYVSTKTDVTDPDQFLAAAVTPAETENTGIFYDNNGMTVGYSADETFYFVTAPAPAHTHGACSCEILGNTCSHTQLTWTAWGSTTSLPTEAGSYYLTGNVTLGAITTVSADVELCLNGFDIDLNGKKIVSTGKLTVMNCQAQVNDKNQLTSVTGKLYNGSYATTGTDLEKYGGAIATSGDLTLIGVLFSGNTAKGADARTGGALYVENGMTTIESCKFEGNQALSNSSTNGNNGVGGAISVYKSGSLNITDTVFENNTADLYGGAICVNNRYSAVETSVTIGGNSVFTGNKTNSTTDGYGAALYLYSRSEEAAGKLTVTIGGNTQITGNTAAKYGAVLLRTNAAAANALDVTISGNINISGNTASNDYRANLYFNDDSRTLKVGALDSGAVVYVSTKSEVADPDAFLAAASGVSLQATENTGIYYDRVDPAETVGYSTDASEKFYFVDETVYEHDDHGACVCSINGSTCSHSVLTWKPWKSASALPTDAGNYFLTGDVTLATATAIGANVNICLNGFDIDLNGKKITNTGKLTIMNCQAQVNEDHQLTSTAGKLYNGAYATSGTDLAKYGGAIGTSGDLTLIGVLFSGNTAKGADARTGGALYVESGMTTIESCKFEGNQALSNSSTNGNNGVGGAISVYKSGSLNITDTVFENNTADLYGGAICVNNRYATTDSTVTISGNSVFTGNKTTSATDGYGSALFLYNRSEDGGKLTVNIGGNTKITGNTAAKDGAVYLRTHDNASAALKFVVADNVNICDNTASIEQAANLYMHTMKQKVQVGQLGANFRVFVGTPSGVGDPDEFMVEASGVTLQNMDVTGFFYTNKSPTISVGHSTDETNNFYFNLAAAEAHTDHSLCDCYLSGESCTDSTLTWKAWIYDDQLPTTAGNWYLTGDVKLAAKVTVKEKVNLCLNGYSLDLNEKVIEVGSAGDLAIINCKAAAKENGQLDETKSVGGKITGGKNTHGAAVNVAKGGKFTAIGVEFYKNNNFRDGSIYEGQGGGAINTEGTIELYACRFIENTTNNHGGAITLYSTGSAKINDCYFSGNTAAKNGGALSVYTGGNTVANVLATLTGDNEFVGNTAEGQGGAIYVKRHANTPASYMPKLDMKNNVTITENVAVKDGGGIAIVGTTTDFRVDLNGTVISKNKANRGGGVFVEKAKLVGTTVTISDNSAEGIGSCGGGITGMGAIISLQTNSLVSGNKTEKGGGGGIYVSNASTINLYNCTVSKNESPDGGGVRIWRNSVLNMKGGIITENHSTAGGGGLSMVKGSILNMESGEISKNTCVNNGGGIYADNYFAEADTEEYALPTLNLSGGRISENTASGSYGGGIYAKNCQTQLSGTKITKNTASKANGGGIYVSKVDAKVEIEENGEKVVKMIEFEPTFTMTGGEVSGNKSKNAGGIYFNEVDATISGGSVKNNTASENAGGISVRTAKLTFKGDATVSGNTGKSGGGVIIQVDSQMDMTGGTIEKNSAKNGGGMLLWSRSVLNLKGGNIKNNKATKGSGGGIYAQGGAHVKMSGGSVSYNTVTSNGGGIYATKNDGYTTRLTVSGGSIVGNYAKNSGGGAYTNKGAVTNVYGGYWASNEVKVCGGGIYANASPLNLYGGTFTKNHAEDCGGAINAKGTKVLLDGTTITENISDARGGGIRIHTDCEFTMKSGEISKNEAARGGAGIAIYSGGINIEGGKITGNKVVGSELYPEPIGGGAILVYEGANVYSQVDIEVNITGGEISGNYSLTNGGAIVLNGRSVMNISGGQIINNVAEQLGGAVIVDSYFNPRAARATLNVTGGEISGNTATDGAAIYARRTGEVNLDGATIEGNTASGVGGALYLGKGTKANLKDSLLTDNKAAQAAGFYAIDDFQMHNLEVTNNDSGNGYAVYIDRGEFDGRSYVLSIIKMTGDIRIHGNHSTDLFIGENAKINVGLEGLGKNTLIDLELETGVLTNTIIGAYNYEGGNRVYTVTYGDRSMTDLEPIPTEETVPQETEPATEPVAEPQQPKGTSIILPIAVGVAALAIVVIVLILLLKRKKNGKKA